METLKTIARRKSTRDFSDRQITDEQLDTLLRAACAAPVGLNEYDNMHLTVVQDKDVLDKIREGAMYVYQDPIRDIYYGAPTVIIISTREGAIAEIQQANAACVAMNIMLAATDIGVDSIYIWGTVPAFRSEPELADEVEIPDGFSAMASVAVGFSAAPDDSEKPMDMIIKVNKI